MINLKFHKHLLAKALLCLLPFLLPAITLRAQKATKKPKYVIIGYVGGYKGVANMEMVNPEKLTHINYAFVNVKNNRAFLSHERTDTINFRNLVQLKKRNPALKVLISIGGWTWSGNFSDAVLTDTAREAFSASAVAIIKKFDLDGIDIDWEYPGMAGNTGNTYRPEDKVNYTLMFKALRHDLDILEKQAGKKLLLTTAVGGFKRFLDHTEMDKAQQYLDYINLMTYDYFQDGSGIAVHHTNLYASKQYQTENYADKAVSDFIAAGVPASKLVLGVAFYGRSSKVLDVAQNGLGMKRAEYVHVGGYTLIKDSLLNRNGFKYYRDRNADAPYLFNAATKQFISYDDEWSIKAKCHYLIKHKMAGVMFWEYADDKKEYLLNEIDARLKAK
ncbi:glycoside hydrolase family 18 protein [Mucilaginibacter sp. HC2]|uniref:glycoside hydrolase family 18 protein n=1 Tax=Mucilaginibacter inviolabilis TaxID=2714892 RepID=UPI00140CD12C|nr:glycoside hydrolase family 18 protein [Mucilaginibacter inviolabilis]NHA04588.1 glycoside hydrolase family 18 protein [Mucilaginibacter inviolabilis]